MTATWMLYALAVCGALSAAGWGAEQALRAHRRPARWAWAAALAFSLLVPAAALLRPPADRPPSDAPSPDPSPGAVLARALPRLPLSADALGGATPFLLAGWSLLSLATLGSFGLGLRQVARRRRRWPRAEIQGVPVRISGAFGPAVAGVLRPEIVLPRWMLGMDARALGVVLGHELEHLHSRDTLLRAAGYVAASAAAWNPFLWWQVRRLGLAVELDCDLRVLRRGVDRRLYGELLLEVGRRSHHSRLAAALSEPTSFLERRMEMILTPRRRGPVLRTAGALALAAGMTAVACDLPRPTAPGAPAPSAEGVAALVEEWSVSRQGSSILDAPLPPLVYVDGVRMTGEVGAGLAELEPDKIARIEVVKGTAATGVFGPEAAGGVVQIFTKAGAPPRR